MLFTLLFWEEHAQFLVRLVVEKHVFHKLFQNILIPNVLFMSDVEREEMKWLKYWKNFQLCL
jgi:hypothetical protein